MLIALDDRRALFQSWADRDKPVFLEIDKTGRQQPLDFADAHCAIDVAPDGKLVLSSAGQTLLVEPEKDFAVRQIDVWDGKGDEPRWTLANLDSLIDTGRGLRHAYRYDRDALDLPDPGYSEPVAASLLPGGDKIAIGIVRCKHMALFNRRTNGTELIELGGSYGGESFMVVGNDLWLTNYDRLCCLDLGTRKLRSSDALQPQLRDPKYGLPMSAFVGVPTPAPMLGGWLVPRPYAGDILLVRSDTLQGDSRLRCSGSPYEVALFPDGSLLYSDNSDFQVRTAHIDG